MEDQHTEPLRVPCKQNVIEARVYDSGDGEVELSWINLNLIPPTCLLLIDAVYRNDIRFLKKAVTSGADLDEAFPFKYDAFDGRNPDEDITVRECIMQLDGLPEDILEIVDQRGV